jgi:hypothetical protein
MRHLHVIHTSDYHPCDENGCSGGGAEGARIELDGMVLVNLIPIASCFGGTSFSEEDILQKILEIFNITDVKIEVSEE